MRSIVSAAALAAVFIAGCTPQYREVGPYHEDGSEKPRAVLLPVADYSLSALPWSLSDEFQAGIRGQLLKRSEVFICSDAVGYSVPPGLDGVDLVERHGSELKAHFPEVDFVVLMELLDHQEVPIDRANMALDFVDSGAANTALQMKIRVQAVDVRGSVAKTVYRETIESNYPIFSAAVFDVQANPWGSRKFDFSVLGRAHSELEKEVAARLEQYLLFAKGRQHS